MNGKEAYDKIFDKLTYDQQQELGDQVLRIVYQDLQRLEKLEKENQELKELFKKHFVYSKKTHTIRKSIKNFDYETIKGVLEND